MQLSIALATYNGEKYLSKQIDSILNQTYSDFELIVSDDCSSDNTWNILLDYARKDKRIKIFKNKHNLGFVKNFENAVLLCSSEYIALSDQDDIWKENHLEILLNNLKDSSASVGNADIMNSFDEISSELLSDRDSYFVSGNNLDRLYRILFYGNPFQGTSALYKKDLFKYAFPITKEVEYHDAWFSAFACCLKGLNYTFDVVTHYRIHGNNSSGSHKVNFIKRIFITLKRKGWKTDRVTFCDELLKRIPNMSDDIKSVVLEAKEFQENRLKGKRIKTVVTIIKNYKRIYATNSYKKMISRCIGILIKG